MVEHKTPDQIEQEIIEGLAKSYYLPENPVEIAIEVLADFRKELAKNGYVFYQP